MLVVLVSVRRDANNGPGPDVMFLKYFTSILDYIRHLFSHRAADDNAGVPLRAWSLGSQEIVARRTRLDSAARPPRTTKAPRVASEDAQDSHCRKS